MDIPKQYVPDVLSPADKRKQIRSIKEKRDRPKVDYPKKRSKWTLMAERYFGKAPSLDDIAKELKVEKAGLEEILEKGRGAYYSSGSRPNQTAESWAKARLYAVIFGSPGARKVDKHIIDKYKIGTLDMKGSGTLRSIRTYLPVESPPRVGGVEPKDTPTPPKALVQPPKSGGGVGTERLGKEIVARKEYPENYSKEINDIVEMLSFTPKKEPSSVEVLGSMSIRSQLWASDYDIMEKVDMSSLSILVKRFQEIIRKLLQQNHIYIGDIKLGNIVDWRVLDDRAFFVDGRLLHYNAEQSRKKLRELLDDGVITKAFYDKGSSLLVDNPTPNQLRVIIKELRPNIQRWKPAEILKGYKTLPTGKRYTLGEAMSSPGVFKLDVIALLNSGIFQEMGMVYDLRVKGRRINDFPYSVQDSLKQDIEFYSATGSWFKVLKRIFSLANYRYTMVSSGKEKQLDLIEKIHPILISDIGILYQVYGDIQSITFLLESGDSVPMERLKCEIDEFIDRLSNVYSVKEYIQNEPSIISKIRTIIGLKSKDRMVELLGEIGRVIERVMNEETRKRMNAVGLAMRGGVVEPKETPTPPKGLVQPPKSGGSRSAGVVQGVVAGKPRGEWKSPLKTYPPFSIKKPETISMNMIIKSRDDALRQLIELIGEKTEHPTRRKKGKDFVDKTLYFNPYHPDNDDYYNRVIDSMSAVNRYRARTIYDGLKTRDERITIPATNDRRQLRKNAYYQAYRLLSDGATAERFDREAERIYYEILENKNMERGADYSFEYARNRYGDIAPGKPRPTP